MMLKRVSIFAIYLIFTTYSGSLDAKPKAKEPEVLAACYLGARSATDPKKELRKCRDLTLNSAQHASSFADLENHALILMRNDSPDTADLIFERLLKSHPKVACSYPSLVSWIEGKVLDSSRSEKSHHKLLDQCGPWSEDSARLFVTLLNDPVARLSFCTYLKKKKTKQPVMTAACSEKPEPKGNALPQPTKESNLNDRLKPNRDAKKN